VLLRGRRKKEKKKKSRRKGHMMTFARIEKKK